MGNVSVLVVCGLRAEAAIAQGDADGEGLRTIVSGGRAQTLLARLEQALDEERPDGVLSFGVAGALAPDLATGQLVVAATVAHAGRTFDSDPPWTEALARRLKARASGLACAEVVVGDPLAKSALREATGAALVDMESGVAAQVCHARGIPFAVLRAISDQAATALPPSAVAGMGPDGEVRVGAVVRSLAGRPHDLPGLLRAARDSAAAFGSLRRARAELGPGLAFTA